MRYSKIILGDPNTMKKTIFLLISLLSLAVTACSTDKIAGPNKKIQCADLKRQMGALDMSGNHTQQNILKSRTAYTDYRNMGCDDTTALPPEAQKEKISEEMSP